MPKINITELAVRALKAEVQTDYWDTNLKGFGIRVGPRSKTFVVKHKNRRFNIGTFPDMGVKEARDEARRRTTTKPTTISDISFKEAAQRYLDQHCRPNNKPSTFAETRRIMSRMPFSGRLDAVTTASVQAFLGKLPPGEANHCFSTLRAFLGHV